jgi:hypothetical protein
LEFVAGTAYPSEVPEITACFKWGSCYSIFSFMCMFCGSLFVLFLLVIMHDDESKNRIFIDEDFNLHIKKASIRRYYAPHLKF